MKPLFLEQDDEDDGGDGPMSSDAPSSPLGARDEDEEDEVDKMSIVADDDPLKRDEQMEEEDDPEANMEDDGEDSTSKPAAETKAEAVGQKGESSSFQIGPRRWERDRWPPSGLDDSGLTALRRALTGLATSALRHRVERRSVGMSRRHFTAVIS